MASPLVAQKNFFKTPAEARVMNFATMRGKNLSHHARPLRKDTFTSLTCVLTSKYAHSHPLKIFDQF